LGGLQAIEKNHAIQVIQLMLKDPRNEARQPFFMQLAIPIAVFHVDRLIARHRTPNPWYAKTSLPIFDHLL
jgi:hypothetical protein